MRRVASFLANVARRGRYPRVKWRSLGWKILAWSFVPTFIVLTAVATVNFVAYQQVTESLVIERDKELARLAAGQLATDLDEYVRLLTTVARTMERGDLQAQQAALKAAGNRLAVFDGGVVFLSGFGRVVATEPTRLEILGRDWSDRDYFQQTLASGRPTFSDIQEDGPAFGDVVAIAVPVVDEGERPLGVLAGFFRVGEGVSNALYSSIVRPHSGEFGSTYLVDGHGRAIFHTNSRRIGDFLGSRRAVQALWRGETGAVRTYEYFEVELVAAYAPVPGTTWGLAIEESWSVVFSASQGYRQLLMALLALGIIVPTLVVAFGVGRITRPIVDLTTAAEAVAAGQFDQVIEVPAGDELAELARQFNIMSTRLQESYAHLEQRVADRTRELATLNEVAAVVSRSLNLAEIMQAALAQTIIATGMDAGEALRLDEAIGAMSREGHYGLSPAFQRQTEALLSAAEYQDVVATGQPQIVDVTAYSHDGRWRAWQAKGIRQLVVVPLVAKDKVQGLFILGRREAGPVSREDTALLVAIGQQVGVAMENAALYEQSERLAVIEERQRLARDLHDSVAQALYSIALFTGAADRMLDAGDVTTAVAHIDEIQNLTQEALQEMRLLIFELRPPILVQEGLVAAIQLRLEAVEGRAGVQTQLEVEGNGRLPAAVEDALYRVAQEALNNTLKHAQAQSVFVRLRWHDKAAFLEVGDDGAGFERDALTAASGLGLPGMAERAAQLGGTCHISSQPGKGTIIQVEIPYD